MLRSLFKPRKKTQTKPHAAGQILALSNAVIIHTYDGTTTGTVVVTPQLARSIAEALPRFAEQAERKPDENESQTPYIP